MAYPEGNRLSNEVMGAWDSCSSGIEDGIVSSMMAGG